MGSEGTVTASSAPGWQEGDIFNMGGKRYRVVGPITATSVTFRRYYWWHQLVDWLRRTGAK